MKKQVTLLFFLLSLLTTNPFAKAQTSTVPPSLSFKEVCGRLAEHNLYFLAEHYAIDLADAQIVQAKLFDNPVVSVEQNVYNRRNGRYFDFGKDGETTVEIEQSIYIAGQRNKRVQLEKCNREMAINRFEELMRTLRGELAETFIELHFTAKSRNLYRQEIASLEQMLAAYRQQNAKGNISTLEKARLEALLLSLRKERNETENRIARLQSNLRLLTGLPGTGPLETRFDENVLGQITLDSHSFAELNARMRERPDLRLAANQIKASEADLRLQRALAFPEVSLKGSYDKAGNFIDDYWAVGVSVSLPLFNRNQGNIRAAKAAIRQNAQRETYARQQAENELYTAYFRLQKAIELFQGQPRELENEFAALLEGVNQSFGKRHISLLEFIDYYESYKTTCLQLYQAGQELVQAAEALSCTVGTSLFSYE